MSDNKIRVLHVFSGVGGGISTWIRKAAYFSNDKYIIDAMAFSISNKAGFVDIIKENGGMCYEMPRIRNGLQTLIMFVTNIIKENDYDVIHCHIDGYAIIPIWFPARVLCGKKIIIHSHRTAIEKIAEKKYARNIYIINRFINKIIARNKVACGEKASLFAFGKSKDVKILYNGINPILDDIIPNNNDDDNEIINIVALGRLNKVKNHHYMLQIARTLKEIGVDFHFYIVGDGDLRDSLASTISELGLEECVSLEGYCDTPEVYLKKCDVLIMPSFSEGLPTVMLEAQEYGCGVISSNLVTRECDLDFGLVSYLGIETKDINSWVRHIADHKKKNTIIRKEIFNSRLSEKGFLNKTIYEEYYEYLKNLVE